MSHATSNLRNIGAVWATGSRQHCRDLQARVFFDSQAAGDLHDS
jgi:hypothetical protein